MHHPTSRIAHTTAFINPVMVHWLEWETAQCVHHEGLIRWPITLWADDLPQREICTLPGLERIQIITMYFTAVIWDRPYKQLWLFMVIVYTQILSIFFKYASNSPNFIHGYYPFSLSTHEIDPKLYTWLLSNFFKYAWNWYQTLYLVIIQFL